VPPPTRWLFGYGSLIERQSRGRTVPEGAPIEPVRVRGFRREWNTRSAGAGLKCTFLGVRPDPAGVVNGLLIGVGDDDWRALDRREKDYCRADVPMTSVEWLRPGADRENPVGQATLYQTVEPAAPDATAPLIQSYVDICLLGCLQVGERLGTGDAFAREFVATTDGWSPHWVNDRVYPRAAFRLLPEAPVIDALLEEHCPEAFAAIRIE